MGVAVTITVVWLGVSIVLFALLVMAGGNLARRRRMRRMWHDGPPQR